MTDFASVNSLPESAYALVNHRIAPQDSVRTVMDHYISLLTPWAKTHDITVNAFGEGISQPAHPSGTLTLTSDYDLDPSPISDANNCCFHLLAGTIRTVFGRDIIVAPTILLGNTDTRYYWDLTSNIYRMSPWRQSHDSRGTRMHTVDERMPIAGLIEMVKFYHSFILNVDEYRG
jgi:Gly-Xaa carboxypeptidase